MVMLSSCDGCSRNPADTQSFSSAKALADAGAEADIETYDGVLGDFDIFPVDERMIIREGLEDFTNRYPFAIMLHASVPHLGTRRCSGAIIAPRLVLTVAHCVCLGRTPPAETEAPPGSPNMNCADKVRVWTAIYDSSRGVFDNLMGSRDEQFYGEIHPHPDFKLDAGTEETPSKEADLAVVVLDRPVASTFRPVRLAHNEPTVGETVVIVGHGLDETSDLTMGVRRFGKKKITGLNREGGFLEQRELVILSSEGGALCLQGKERDAILVGLISGYSDERPAFTGVYRYRDWLLSEIQQAALSKPKDSRP